LAHKENQMEDKVVSQVVYKYSVRSEAGIRKYGQTLERSDVDLLGWLNHLQEELMDATLYIQKLKNEIENGKQRSLSNPSSKDSERVY
jgi:succinate dehydrogenase flavin-adding protein (antitoxin of CptAB toxin-antitoxin module)